MKKTIATITTVIISLTICGSAFAVGENMLNTTSGSTYAGYGYTHGPIPVTDNTDTASFYDSDIWRYDINTSKPADSYYTQDDLKHNTVEGVPAQYSPIYR